MNFLAAENEHSGPARVIALTQQKKNELGYLRGDTHAGNACISTKTVKQEDAVVGYEKFVD
jgi:hypothetical protein